MTSLSLVRKVFTTSRLAEFCSEKELVNQTGSDDWPLVVLKELIDNALDACEEAGAAPVIHVAVSDAEIAVFDNGPGIAPETVMARQRVELNAMTSDQFVAFVERNLTEAGIAKIVLPKDQLEEAFRLFVRSKKIEEVVEKAIAEITDVKITIPDDLEALVRAYLAEHPDEPWEGAVRDAAGAAQ